MNKVYQKVSLDSRANSYLVKNIEEFGLLLSKLILEKIDLKDGKFISFLPNYISPEEVYNFENGMFLEAKIAYAHSLNYVFDKFKKSNVNVCIAESRFVHPLEILKVDSKSDEKYFFYNNEVYSFGYKQDIKNKEEMEDVFYASFSTAPASVGILSYTTKTKLLNKTYVDNNFLEEIASNTQLICIQAYHNDGCIIWEN